MPASSELANILKMLKKVEQNIKGDFIMMQL